jgi:hypothetical protein
MTQGRAVLAMVQIAAISYAIVANGLSPGLSRTTLGG